MTETFVRTITLEESRGRFVWVTNDGVRIFPPVGKVFTIIEGRSTLKGRLESKRCTCLGPDKPHVHHYLVAPFRHTLRPGDKLVFERSSRNRFTMKRARDQ